MVKEVMVQRWTTELGGTYDKEARAVAEEAKHNLMLLFSDKTFWSSGRIEEVADFLTNFDEEQIQFAFSLVHAHLDLIMDAMERDIKRESDAP